MGTGHSTHNNASNIYGRTLKLRKAEPVLTLDGGDAVAIYVNGDEIHVGCVTIEVDAWRELCRKVNERLK